MEETAPLNEEQVRAWLLDHPERFPILADTLCACHPELCTDIGQSRIQNDIVSFKGGRKDLLQQRVTELEAELDDLHQRIHHNERIYRTFRALRMRLVATESIAELILLLTMGLEKVFDLTRVNLILIREKGLPGMELADNTLQEELDQRLITHDRATFTPLLEGGIETLVRIGQEGHNRHLLFGDHAQGIRAESLTPLLQPQEAGSVGEPLLVGCLAMGESNPSRLTPGQSSDLLADLVETFTIRLFKLTADTMEHHDQECDHESTEECSSSESNGSGDSNNKG
ncbi:MAG: DUF484 family protein [Magnetococcales bacterium]|nr:DUF484 family protein [Magnetococcales bacterium]